MYIDNASHRLATPAKAEVWTYLPVVWIQEEGEG
jgi:hypothetical protein